MKNTRPLTMAQARLQVAYYFFHKARGSNASYKEKTIASLCLYTKYKELEQLLYERSRQN